MAPNPISQGQAATLAAGLELRGSSETADGRGYADQSVVVEAWAQGMHVGALLFIILIVLCNYRRRVLLHKLILSELVLALWHGVFIFFSPPTYAWFLSGTAVPLYVSYNVHNVVAWIKIKPFLPTWGGRFFIVTLLLVQPYWAVEAWANFSYFNNLGSEAFTITRYMEPAMRDPWWVFTTIKLVLVINSNYDYTLTTLVRLSPRFGILILCMFMSIVFIIVDIISTALLSVQSGINPYWRLALVFKCASDAIFLDDFKSVLDRIAASALKDIANHGSYSHSGGDHKGSVGGGAVHSGLNRFNPLSKLRRSSSGRFPAMVHPQLDKGPVSANKGPGMAEPPRAYSRGDRWVGSRLNTQIRSDGRAAAGSGGGVLGRPGQILAETTITISEQEEAYQKPEAHTEHREDQDRSSSQERILPTDNKEVSAPRSGYGWDADMGGRRPTDAEMGIPMVPVRRLGNSWADIGGA